MELDNSELPAKDPKYSQIDKNLLPRCECLKDTVERFLPFWHDTVVPQVKVSITLSGIGNRIKE